MTADVRVLLVDDQEPFLRAAATVVGLLEERADPRTRQRQRVR